MPSKSWGQPGRYVIFLSSVSSPIVKIKCCYCLVFDYDSRSQTCLFLFLHCCCFFCVHSSSCMLYQNRMWWLVQIKSIEMLMLIYQINRRRKDYRKHKATSMVSLCNPSIECLGVFLSVADIQKRCLCISQAWDFCQSPFIEWFIFHMLNQIT